MTRLQPRLTILFALAVLLAGCGSVTARTNVAATASVVATFVRKADLDLEENPFPSLPVTVATGQSLIMLTAITAPTAPGYYRFSFSGRVDSADLPFAPLADELLLAPARRWSGDACLKPAMQSQIPSGSKDYYICPTLPM